MNTRGAEAPSSVNDRLATTDRCVGGTDRLAHGHPPFPVTAIIAGRSQGVVATGELRARQLQQKSACCPVVRNLRKSLQEFRQDQVVCQQPPEPSN